MQLRDPEVWQRGSGDSLDEWLAALHNAPAVFLVHAAEGEPYLGRTGLLRRRLLRLLGRREHSSPVEPARGGAA
jgi:hypothetical protein